MSWVPWRTPIEEVCNAPDALLKSRGEGENFFYGTCKLSDHLYGLGALRGDSLVFLGLCQKWEDLWDCVLEDAQSRPCWSRAKWEKLDSFFPPNSSKLELWGTPFQTSVWRELLNIPEGSIVTYQFMAERVGNPKASRAVGGAIGANPLAGYIPCHRVVSKSADMSSYRWGSDIKEIFLREEHTHTVYKRQPLDSKVEASPWDDPATFRYGGLWF